MDACQHKASEFYRQNKFILHHTSVHVTITDAFNHNGL